MIRLVSSSSFLFLFFLQVFSQTSQVDSLHLLLNNSVGEERIAVLNTLSELELSSNTNDAGHYAKVAIDIAKEDGFKQGEATGYENLAKYFIKKNKGDSGVWAYEKAISYYETTNKVEFTANAYNAMGITLMNISRYSESLDYLVKGLILRQQIGDRIAIGYNYYNMALVMERLKEPQQALEYYDKALEYLEESENEKVFSTALLNTGVVYFSIGNNRKANDYFSQALEIQQRTNDDAGLMKTYMHMGNLSMKTNDFNGAIVFYNMVLFKATDVNDQNFLSGSYVYLGDLYGNHMTMYEKGLEYLGKGLSLAKITGNKEWENQAYKAIAECYSQMKEFDKAFKTEKLFAALNDSLIRANALMDEERAKTLTEFQRLKLRDSEKQIAKVDAEKTTISRRMYIISGVTIFIALALLLLYLKEKKHL